MESCYDGYLTPECMKCKHWRDESNYNFGCNYPFNDCKHMRVINGITSNPMYVYSGPVMLFDECIVSRWEGTTRAVSERKARSNLTYQWKINNGYAVNAKITLPGRITVVE